MYYKEFIVPIPFSLEKYRIAQLYCAQKKCRCLSQESSDGITMDANETIPNHEVYGECQYTKKTIHLSEQVPSWLSSLIPKSLVAIEEAYNSFPKTHNKYTCSAIPSFEIDIETVFLPGVYQEESSFQLSEQDRANFTGNVLVDIANENLTHGEYNIQTVLDFVPEKSGLNALSKDWFEKAKADPDQSKYCHARKLVKINLYVPLLTKIIVNKTFNSVQSIIYEAHVNSWIWQDEWYHLTIEDIRKIEEEAKEHLDKLAVEKGTVDTAE